MSRFKVEMKKVTILRKGLLAFYNEFCFFDNFHLSNEQPVRQNTNHERVNLLDQMDESDF